MMDEIQPFKINFYIIQIDKKIESTFQNQSFYLKFLNNLQRMD